MNPPRCRRHARGAFVAGATSLLLAATLVACDRGPQAPAAPVDSADDTALAAVTRAAAGQPGFPALSVRTIDGADWDLRQHRGRWVVVNFWATWCAPCLKEMPELSALDAMREDVAVIGLAYEDTTAAELRAFLQARPVVYPVAIVDLAAPPADFETPPGLPMTWLLAPDGRVAKKFLGPVDAAELEAAIATAAAPTP